MKFFNVKTADGALGRRRGFPRIFPIGPEIDIIPTIYDPVYRYFFTQK